MAWPPGEHLENVIAQVRLVLEDVNIVRHDINQVRAILDIEGRWRDYRIIVSEIHRTERDVRYAYYALDHTNKLVHAFDNSPDNVAIKQRYGTQWKNHLHEEIPHQHHSDGTLTITPEPITFTTFIAWLEMELQ
ncbi:MAG: hypothetical protein D3905_02810 [Candidatus Electrothrix sp. AS4_5]|nr:hypothetical protein [Candidatus Electrothrix gigas]